ncbi:MAG: S9 family peptidase, partial [Bacteroidales bacterium]|nr:S9 family peptidase [Bacteroidales bacterium]
MNLKTLILTGGMIMLSTAIFAQVNIKYPKTLKGNVKDTYFGTVVADPYRWLENDTTKEVAEWVAAENKVTESYLNAIPFRNSLKNRLTEVINYEKIGAPFAKHGKYYFFKNDGLQNQSVFYVKETLHGEPSILLDPNTLSEDGTVALQGIYFSRNGKYLAYTISRSGSDWKEIFVMDLATKKLLKDHIVWAKFTGASWCGNGF